MTSATRLDPASSALQPPDVPGARDAAVSFDVRTWITLPALFAAIALGELLPGVLGLAAGVVFGATALGAAWPLVRARRFRPSRALFYGGLLFVGAPVLRPLAGVTVADVFFAASFVACMVELLASRGRRPFRLPPLLIVVGSGLVLVGSVVSGAFSVTPASAVGAGIRFLLVTVVWVWLGVLVLERREHMHLAILSWGVSAAGSSVAAVVQLLFGNVIPGTSTVWGRMTGLGEHVTELGAIAATAGLALGGLAAVSRPRDRYLIAGLGLLALGGLVLSGSVSNGAGAVLGVAVAGVLGGRGVWRVVRRPKVLAGLAVAAAVFAGAIAVAVAAGKMPSPWQRLTTTTQVTPHGQLQQQRATLLRRLDTFSAAWHRIEKRPILGAGMNPDQLGLVGGRTYVHDTVLGAWAGLGLLAGIGVLICLVAPFVGAGSLLRSGEPQRAVVIGLTAAAVSFTVYALASPALYRRFGWVPALLIGVLWAQQAAPLRLFASASPERRRGHAPGPLAVPGRRPTAVAAEGAPPHPVAARRLGWLEPMRVLLPFVAGALLTLAAVGAYVAATRHDRDASTPAAATTSAPRPSTRAIRRGTRLQEQQQLANVRARQWVAVNCGTNCVDVRLVRHAYPLWELRATYANDALKCFVLNVREFDQRGRHGHLLTGFQPITCAGFTYTHVRPVHSASQQRTELLIRRWALYYCGGRCHLFDPQHVSGALWQFGTAYGKTRACYLLDTTRYAEYRKHFAGFTVIPCALPHVGTTP